MIGELADRVRANLAARKFPHRVTYAPEYAEREAVHAASVVFARDRETPDAVGAPTGWRGAPDADAPLQRRNRAIVRVYAKSSKPGATARDHEDECDRVCDGVWTAVYQEAKGFLLETTTQRFLRAADLADQQAWAGCVAELRFSLCSRIRHVDYTGAGPDTGEIGSVHAPTVESPDFPDYEPVP